MAYPYRGQLVVFLPLLFTLSVRADGFKYKVGDTLPLPASIKADLESSDFGKSYLNGTASYLLLAFVPTVTPRCEYARMMSKAFSMYFQSKMAFDETTLDPNIPVIDIYTGDRDKSTIGKFQDENKVFLNTTPDPVYSRFKELGVPVPTDDNADATVILLDAKGVIRYVSTDYRGQGEKLKVLEKAVKNLLELDTVSTFAQAGPGEHNLRVGQRALDFDLNGAVAGRPVDGAIWHLSDLRGHVVVVSFYPAPYSGLFPDDGARRETALAIPTLSNLSLTQSVSLAASLPQEESSLVSVGGASPVVLSLPKKISVESLSSSNLHSPIGPVAGTIQVIATVAPGNILSLPANKKITAVYAGVAGCGGQVKSFDRLETKTQGAVALNGLSSDILPVTQSGGEDKPVVLLISASTIPLVRHWAKDLEVKNLVMINDPDFRIAAEYGSVNPAGYDDRTVFVVDKNGVIRYINWNYQVGDADLGQLQAQINELEK